MVYFFTHQKVADMEQQLTDYKNGLDHLHDIMSLLEGAHILYGVQSAASKY